jgi:2-iminobutanoate/2-iminopropanoate deaminase
MSLKKINTPHAPAAIGPYSQAVEANGFLFVSGQLPLDPTSGQVVQGGIREQASQVLLNLTAILDARNLGVADVVRCDIFIKNMGDFPMLNEVYGSIFNCPVQPARQTVEVSRLPKDVLVEISCIAACKKA